MNHQSSQLILYRSIKNLIDSIKCSYCSKDKTICDQDCIEIKGTTKLKPKDKRRLFNLLKKQNNYGVFINNSKVCYEELLYLYKIKNIFN